MAYLYITEFSRAVKGAAGEDILAPDYDYLTAKQPRIAITGGSTPTLPLNSQTRYVKLHVDAICSIAYGPEGGTTADPNFDRVGANETQFIGATGGNVFAVITNT